MNQKVSIPYCSTVVKCHEFFIRSCVRYDKMAYVSDLRSFTIYYREAELLFLLFFCFYIDSCIWSGMYNK